MEIVVTQKKISIGDKYNIFTNGQPTHKASKRLLQLLAEIRLFESNGITTDVIINRRFTWLKPAYDITNKNLQVLSFRTKSFWKRHYQCQSNSDTYDIYRHRGLKYSIFKNDQQVAWWGKSIITWFEGDSYRIIANDDCDVDLIISFCLIIDNISGNHDTEVITLNIGNIGFQARKFDPQWQPR
ncbi:MAG TPA: hypothetical protein VN040_27535 [Pseudosphingobacterium sp.]|nr:hypothetical protein [Pseudosphingobacterium sp.]